MFRSTLTITSAASDRTLLSLVELRDAVGVSSGAQDTKLKRLNASVAAALTAACNVPGGGATPATLRQETFLVEYKPDYTRFRHSPPPSTIQVPRRPVASVTSVVEAGTTLTANDYSINAATGELTRQMLGRDSMWAYDVITVVCVAGWDVVPDLLKEAAVRLARDWWFESNRDPSLKSMEIPGVINESYRWASVSEQAIPQDVLDLLAEFRNPLV